MRFPMLGSGPGAMVGATIAAAGNVVASQRALNKVHNYNDTAHVVRPQRRNTTTSRSEAPRRRGSTLYEEPMAYKRYTRRPSRRRGGRRRVRRRRRIGRGVGRGRPSQYHRIRHRLDSWLYLSCAETAFSGNHTNPYQIYDSEQTFDIKLNDLHDPYSLVNIAGVTGGVQTSFTPLFYNTMKTLYKTFKVNNVYVELTFTNNRPVHTEAVTEITATNTRIAAKENELPILSAAEPVIIGAYPLVQTDEPEASNTSDDSWAYRPGAKTYLLHSQQSRTVKFKLNPARILGVPNSFASDTYVPTTADIAPSKVVALRVAWIPPVTGTTAGYSDKAVSVFCRTWWDVTWGIPLNDGDAFKPGAT